MAGSGRGTEGAGDAPPPVAQSAGEPIESVSGDISNSEFGLKPESPESDGSSTTPSATRGQRLPPLTGQGDAMQGIEDFLPPSSRQDPPLGTNPWAGLALDGRDALGRPARPPDAEQADGDPDVHDEGTGLDIPTISVPGAATAGAPASGGGMPRAGIFLPVGIALLILASLASLRVMTAGTEAASTAAPTTTSRPSTPIPTTTSVPVITTATPQPSRTTPVFVVTGHPATYFGGPKCSQMTVAFSWTIDGLGNNGNYVLQFANYGQGYGSENGPFTITASSNATQTWDPPTHLLTLRMPVGEIPTEWGARITKVLNTPIQGDGESKAAMSPCTQG